MSTKLLRLVKRQSEKLSASAPEIFWSLLSQLYRAHKSSGDIGDLLPVLKARDFNAALDLADRWSTQSYGSAYEHYMFNQFAYLIKKQVLPSRYNPRANALAKFASSELHMERVNRRFSSWCLHTDFGVSPTRAKYNKLLRKMEGFISYVIGDEPNLYEVFSKVGFGPGASLGVHGDATNAMRKLSVKGLTVTPRAMTYLASAISQNLWLRRKFSPDPDGFVNGIPGFWVNTLKSEAEFVRYNKLALVPKTAKTLRTIAVEPLGNSLLQKGADLVLRSRLKRVGIDLSRQEINQEFARIGSLELPERGFATIDLSSASDHVATEVVRKLFPPAWFEFLNSIRSESYEIDGERRPYHKFCSMGNGTCFPVETLIFVAACHAVGCGNPGKDFTVYGDDIIVPSAKARDLIKLLRILGHTTNKEKTFIEGPFRESCGEDWFGGISVRPFVFDYALDSVQNVFKFLNQTKSRTLWVDFFQPVRQYVVRLIPENLRFFRPFKGEVETGIDGEPDEVLISKYCTYRCGTWYWTQLRITPKEDVYWSKTDHGFSEPPDFVKWYGVHTLTSGTGASVSLRKRKSIPPYGDVWFTLRNRVTTSVVREHSAGATSNWLPRDSAIRGV